MSLILALPQSTVCVLCACRLYINLADEARQAHEASQQSLSYADRLKYTGGGSGSGGQTSTNSSGSKSKSRKARFANYLFRKDGGVENTAVPSYFSSSSATRAQTGLSENSNVSPSAGGSSSSEEFHERRFNRATTNANTASNRGQTRTIPASQSSNEDLEKQAGRSTNTLDEQFYDSRSTAEGIPRTPQEDDEVVMQQQRPLAPVSQSRHQLAARVPPRNSSGFNNGNSQARVPLTSVHRDDGVQVETVNYVVVEDAPAYTPSAYNPQSSSRNGYASPRPYNERRPGTAEGRQVRQHDDEIAQPSSRYTVRKEAPRS